LDPEGRGREAVSLYEFAYGFTMWARMIDQRENSFDFVLGSSRLELVLQPLGLFRNCKKVTTNRTSRAAEDVCMMSIAKKVERAMSSDEPYNADWIQMDYDTEEYGRNILALFNHRLSSVGEFLDLGIMIEYGKCMDVSRHHSCMTEMEDS